MQNARSKKILIVLTSHDDLGGTGKTGFYVSETAYPWQVFTQAGYQVDLVSPQGGEPPQDGADLSDPIQKAFLGDAEMARKLTDTLRPEDVDAQDYAAIFYAGGHGTMWDFPRDAGLAGIPRHLYEAGRRVAAAS